MALDRVAEFVRMQMAKVKLSSADLAKNAGVPEPEITALMDGTAYPSSDCIVKISGYLDTSPSEMEYKKTNMYGELKGVEIFATGRHGGEDFYPGDLDQISNNFTSFAADLKPPMVLGHDENSPIVRNSGLPALGWTQRVYRDGNVLKADFSDVPDLMKQAIEAKRYRRISVGLYTDYKGKGLALRHVGFLGADIPEVKSLQDILALDRPELIAAGESFRIANDHESFFAEADAEATTKKEADVTKEEMDKALAEREARFNEVLATERKGATEAAALAKKNFDEAMAKRDEQIKGLSDSLAAGVVAKRRAELDGFVKSLSESGQVPPRFLEGAAMFMESLDGSTVVTFSETRKETPLAYFQSFLKQLPTIVRMGEESLASGGIEGEVGLAPKFHGVEAPLLKSSVELHTLAEKEVRENPALKDMKHGKAYAEAVSIVAARRPDLVKVK